MQEGGVEDRPGPAARGTNGDHEAPFGAELKRLRYAAGLTQEELASRAGLTAKAVSALERDVRKRPYPHTVRSPTDALDLTDAERATLQAAVPGRGERVRAPDVGAPPRSCARNQADYEQAQRWLKESLVLRRELGDKKGTAEVLINLGTVTSDRGDYPRSTALEGESLSLWRKLGDRWGIALALNNLGITMRAQGDLAEAASLHEESLDLFRALEDTGASPSCSATWEGWPKGGANTRRPSRKRGPMAGDSCLSAPSTLGILTEPGTPRPADISYSRLKPCRSKRSGTRSMWNVRP